MISLTAGSSRALSRPGRNGFRCSSPLAALIIAPRLWLSNTVALRVDSEVSGRPGTAPATAPRHRADRSPDSSPARRSLAGETPPPALLEGLGSADAPSASPGASRERGDFRPLGGLADGVGSLDLRHLPAELRGDLRGCVITQRQEDPGAERLQKRPPRLGCFPRPSAARKWIVWRRSGCSGIAG